jgi:hypothetical protein
MCQRNFRLDEILCGGWADGDLAMVLRGYFDDSGDPDRKRFAVVGGLIGGPPQWEDFDKHWNIATYELPEPFHSTDCEARRGCCEGWSVEKSAKLMKQLTGIIARTRLGAFGAVVPITDYRAVFPASQEYDPYFLALKQAIINMAYIGRLSAMQGTLDSITICLEDGDTSGSALQIYHDLKSMPDWVDAKYLAGFSLGDKRLAGLQGADLIAREAFKHADNQGKRKTRKTVKAIHKGASFHLWTRAALEYLRDHGGPDDLKSLTTWGQRGDSIPQMTTWFANGFDLR